jgi:hypothetical protein
MWICGDSITYSWGSCVSQLYIQPVYPTKVSGVLGGVALLVSEEILPA